MSTAYLDKQRQDKMQKSSRKLDMGMYREALGDDIPDLPLSRIGKYRLMQMLRFKYGAGFKNVGAAIKLLTNFERQMKLNDLGV